MVKVFSPSGWEPFEGQVARLVKVSASGLRGNDRSDFVKRAGAASDAFLPYLDSVKFAADEEPVHLIGVGASEYWGLNRNGDGFKEATCKRCHDTFVKYARYFRNHKNKDPRQSYGTVKLSAYNGPMHRIELLVGLNKEKSAADRNGGFVADKELTKLARGDDLAVSMACRIPYDKCTYCGNKARTREEYCKAASCKAGGCTDNLAKLVKTAGDAFILGVDNPDPVFFDMSGVFKPADRTAYGTRADYLDKAASDGFAGVGGALLAEELGVTAPLAVILGQDYLLPGERQAAVRGQLKLAHALADAEDTPALRVTPETYRAFSPDVQPPVATRLNGAEVGEPGSAKMAAFLGALAARGVILPLRDFAALTKRAELTDGAAPCVPGAYRRMIADGSLERRVAANPYAPAEKLAAAPVRRLAERLAADYALTKEAVADRCVLSALRGHRPPPVLKTGFEPEKRAADGQPAAELALDYALYKLAALYRVAQTDVDFTLTARLAVAQNHVI